MDEKMRAVLWRKYGSPELLSFGSVDIPRPKKDEILVKIVATTVNRTDCATLRAKPFFMRLVTGITRPKKGILGTEFAGRVEEVGESVTKFKVSNQQAHLKCFLTTYDWSLDQTLPFGHV